MSVAAASSYEDAASRAQRRQRRLEFSTAGGFVLSIAAAGIAAGESIHSHNWAAFTIYVVTAAFLAWLGYDALDRRRAIAPRPTEVFTPFVPVEDLRPWKRDAEVEALSDRLKRGSRSPLLVVGTSGVGKTVILKRLLPEADIARVFAYSYFDTYLTDDPFQEYDVHHVLLASSATQTKRVIIFDQFEQYLALISETETDRRRGSEKRFAHNIEVALATGLTQIIFVIRKEWFYNLRFLGDLVPAPNASFAVSGPDLSRADPVIGQLESRFEQIGLGTEDAAGVVKNLDRNGVILPVEAQIVGSMLERDSDAGIRISSEDFLTRMNGLQGTIDAYFEEALQGAPNREISLKVLFALSTRTRFRQQQSLPDIVESLFTPRSAIRDACGYLEAQGLVISRGTNEYELAHDYLAEYFQYMSGSQMDPVDRDNILFHLESDHSQPGSGLVKSVAERERTQAQDKFAVFIIIFLYITCTVRLLCFGWHWVLAGPIPIHPVLGRLLDVNYLPTYVSHIAWATYIWLFYDRFLSQLRTGHRGALFSRIVVLNMALCVVAAFFFPPIWAASIGWGGLVLSARLFSVASNAHLNKLASERIKGIARVTGVNLALLLVLSVIASVYTFLHISSHRQVSAWVGVSTGAALALTYAAITIAPIHVLRGASGRWLGLLARSDTRPILSASL